MRLQSQNEIFPTLNNLMSVTLFNSEKNNKQPREVFRENSCNKFGKIFFAVQTFIETKFTDDMIT